MSDILDSGLNIATAKNYVDANPEDPLGYFALGILYLEDNKLIDAQRVFSEVVRQREPSVELLMEVFEYLKANNHDEAAIRLVMISMNLYSDNEVFREQGREYLYDFVDSSNDDTDVILLCRISEGSDNLTYTQALMGLHFINNNLRLNNLRWPRACSEDVQAPIEELIRLNSDIDLLPEIQLIQAKYYYRTNDASTAQTILNELLANETIPDWLRAEVEDTLSE